MGMFYASEAYVGEQSGKKEEGQGRRDRIRCLELEKLLNTNVYTVDNKHDITKNCGEENSRHYYGRFDDSRFLSGLKSTLSINGDISMVLFDLYFIPEGSWIRENWRKTLYVQVIPGDLIDTLYQQF